MRRFLSFFLPLILVASTFSISPAVANVATQTVGSAPCVQLVQNTTGVVVTEDGSACVVRFTYAGTDFGTTGTNVWKVPANVSKVQLLLIGGGGAGGGGIGGGGGGGEFVSVSDLSVAPGNEIGIGVGNGGYNTSWLPGKAGENSSFGDLVAYGGGGGGTNEGNGPTASKGPNFGSGEGPNFGSGGGGGYPNLTNAGSNARLISVSSRTVTSQSTFASASALKQNGGGGSNGGSASATGGGGGGANQAGEPGNIQTQSGGKGGDGQLSSITGASVRYAAGGGGGVNSDPGALSSGGPGDGGGGGGGDGGARDGSLVGGASGLDGQVNTGSGGGGASNGQWAGRGGSGVVIVRYTLSAALNPTFGTPTATADGFTVSITNYNESYTWATPTVTAGSVSAGTPSGSNRLLTVTGLTPGQSATITQGTSRNGYSNGTATVEGTATLSSCLPSSDTSSSPGYTILKFTSIGTCGWTTPDGVTAIEVAVIAGGGGGGFGSDGGGGGAGEVLVTGSSATLVSASNTTVTTISTISATPGSTTVVTVGAGGTSGAPNGNQDGAGAGGTWTFGGNGSASSFGGVTATGGGGGGGAGRVSGAQGGSGGGGATAGSAGAAGTNTAPDGWKSFRNSGSTGGYGAGGGAGGAGGAVAPNRGGRGITLWGNNRVAGGGGGWQKLGSEGDLSDTLLGGNGRTAASPFPFAGTNRNTSAGVANTGTGGGAGAPGGSGVVIVRYVNGAAAAAAITTQPSGAVSRSTLTTQPVIRIIDGNGTTVTSSTVNVVASIASGTGTLSGTTTVAAVSGIATFTNLVITGTGNHTLTFTPTSLAAVTSSSFAVSNTVITANALTSKVTAPVRAATPSTTAVDDTQYSGTVAWFESNGTTAAPSTFAANTIYIAKVTLTAKTGYTLSGLTGTFTYTDATSVSYSSGVVTITFAATESIPRTISIDAGSYTSTYTMVATPPTLTATASAGTGAKTFSSSTLSICTVNSSSGLVAFVAAGTCTISASIAADSTYASATSSSISFTTTLATQTVTWAPTTSLLTTASPATPSSAATTSGNGGISYAVTSAGTTGCTVNSSTGVLTFTTAGSCEVTATAAATSNYTTASTAVTFVISLATRTLTIDSGSFTSTYTMVATPPTLSATASAGTGTKTFSSTTVSVCTINSTSGLVAFVSVGTCTIAASIVADSTYLSATSSSISFTTTLATQTVTWAPTTSLLTTASPATPSTAATALGSATISYAVTNAGTTGCSVNSSTGVLTYTAPGSCSVVATAAATASYATANRAVTFVISLATRTLTIDAGSYTSTHTMVATPPTLTATASAGTGTKTFTSSTLSICNVNSSSGLVAFVAAGTCTISASIAADSTYASVTSSSISFTTTLATQTVTRTSTSPTSPLKNGTYTPSATASSGLAVAIAIATSSSSICSISAGVVTFNNVGSCVIEYNQSGNSSYAAALQVSETLTIGKATPTFSTWSDVIKSFGDANFTITAPSETGSLPGSFVYTSATSSVISISGTTLTVAGAGSSVITATFTPTDDANFNNAMITMTVTVSTRAITITVGTPASTVYTGSSVSVTNSFAVTTGSLAGSNAISGMTYTYTSAGGYNSTTAPTAAGTYTITGSSATFSSGSSANYQITYVAGTLTITKANQSALTITSTSGTFGSTLSLTTSGGSSAGAVTYAVNSGPCTVSSATLSNSGAGTCVVTATMAGGDNYNNVSSSTTSITISKADQTAISSPFLSVTSKTPPFSQALTVSVSGGSGTGSLSIASVVNGTAQGCTLTGSTLTASSIGTCTLTITKAADDNYNASSTTATFTFTTGTQIITWSPTTALSATSSPVAVTAATALDSASITYAVQSAGTTSCTVNASTAELTFTAPGSCTVRATAGATSSYAAGTTDVTFTITAAALSDPSTPTAAATLGVLKSIAVTWTAVTNASSYTLKIYANNGTTVLATITGLSGTSRTITVSDYSSLADSTAYKVSIAAIGTGNYSSSNESSQASVTTASGYTLTYSYDGATSGNADATTSFITGASATTLPVPGKTGYTFDGWYEASNLSGTKLSATYTPTQTGTIYAKWIANTLTITYNSQGGSAVNAGSVTTDATIAAAPTAPTRAGYTFSGWSTTSTGSVISFTGGYTHSQTASFTLFAIWSANSLAVTFDSKSGSSVSSTTVNTGASISAAPTAPTRAGYSFAGWSATDGGSAINFPYAHGQAANFTLYAIWNAGSLVVTYDSKGGSSVSNGAVNTAASISAAPTAPTRAGYTFGGWSTTDGGSAINFPYAHGQTANFTLYAKWAANSLTITYDSKGGSSVASGSTVTDGSISVAPTAPTKANFTFAGWSATDGGTAVTFPFTHEKTANFTLYALWTANSYVLTYVYNSADGGTRPVNANFTTGGSPIVLPTPTRIGYTFDGWHSNITLTSPIGAAGANYSPTGSSLTPSAFAKWAAIDYQVTYSAATKTGGSVPTDLTNYNIGQNVVIKANSGSLVRTGYTFAGWTFASDGTGDILNSGSTYVTQSANMTFFAKWSANTYTITFNKNGGSGAPANTSTTYTTAGTQVNLTTAPGSLSGLTKTGFDLSGWSESPTGSVISTGYTTTADVTLYAIWTLKSISITFSKGIAVSPAVVNSFPSNTSLTYGSTLTLAGNVTSTVVISGAAHAFAGWTHGGNIYRGGDTFLIGETAPTFVAEWVKIFAVRYAMNGGTAASSSSEVDAECTFVDGNDLRCLENQDITTNAAPSRAGYTFAGWTNQGGTTVPTAGITRITTTNYLFYANWTAINYAISYNTAGGSDAPSEAPKQIGQTFALAATPTRTGYNFAGWSDGNSVFGAGVTYIVGTSPVNFTAQWTPKIYTVIYDWNGGVGTPTPNDSYTVATTALTLPVVGNRVKDGYTFSGWSTSDNGTLISGGFTPTADTTLYAIWGTGSYTLTYDANGGTVGTTSAAVQNGTSLTLPTPTRSNFVFEGWFSALTGGASIGAAGANFLPAQSRTVYARWTQSSLYGLAPSALTRIGTVTASATDQTTFTNSNANSSVTVVIPAGALPAGTTVNFDRVGDLSRAQNSIAGNNNYIISIVVSWITSAGTVPDTAAGTSLSVTISNSSIKAGAVVYAIVAGSVEQLGTATENGTVTVALRKDPEVVVVATKPNAPTNLTVTSSSGQAVLTWTAPATDGGSEITGYTVSGTGGVSCSTTVTSCTITGLTAGASYTYTVTATNAIGTSDLSTSVSATSSTRPGSPTAVQASANGTGQSVISWTAPASDGGSAITGYTATANGGAFCTTAITSCTITGLADATTYTFTVVATNVIGTSDPSSSASAITASAVVNNTGGSGSSGSGGGSSTPVPVEPVAPSTPVKSNITLAPSVTVVGDTEVKIPTVDVTVPTAESQIKPPILTLDAASKKFIAEVKVVEGKIVLTAETGFSGKRTVTVTITENGAERFVQIPLTVLPEPVTKPVLTPTAATKSIIRWSASDNADSYSVLLNSKRICSTSTTSCSVNRLLGPDALVEIVSNGGDRTLSERIKAEFKQINPVTITRIVSATITKSTLSAVDTKALDQVVALIKIQGFGTVVISEITTTSKTKTLAVARIESIKKYITSKIGAEEVEFEVTPVKSRTYFNNISVKA